MGKNSFRFEMEKFIGLCRLAICIQRFSRTVAEMPRETFCENPWNDSARKR